VLRVIANSAGDLQPAFETILASATGICGAKFGILNIYDGGIFRTVAFYNAPPDSPKLYPVRSVPTREAASVTSKGQSRSPTSTTFARQPYLDGDRAAVALADLAGACTLLIVPMLKGEGADRHDRHLPAGGAPSPISSFSLQQKLPL
jgi:hypothetical protein